MANLRTNIIRLAHQQPELRTDLLPLLKQSSTVPIPRYIPAYIQKIEDYLEKMFARNKITLSFELVEDTRFLDPKVFDKRKRDIMGGTTLVGVPHLFTAIFVRIADSPYVLNPRMFGGAIAIVQSADPGFYYTAVQKGNTWQEMTSNDPAKAVDHWLKFFIPVLLKEIRRSVATAPAEPAQKQQTAPVDNLPPEGGQTNWSAVLHIRDGYVGDVQTDLTFREAVSTVLEDGPGSYLVQGTQMWNEPLGQVEEHDRVAKYYGFDWVNRKYGG